MFPKLFMEPDAPRAKDGSRSLPLTRLDCSMPDAVDDGTGSVHFGRRWTPKWWSRGESNP